MSNPVKSGPVRYTPEQLAEKQAEVDKINAELRAQAMPTPRIIHGNYPERKIEPVRDNECPQCRGYMIGFNGQQWCADCGLPRGAPLEKSLRESQARAGRAPVFVSNDIGDFYEAPQPEMATVGHGTEAAPVVSNETAAIAAADSGRRARKHKRQTDGR